MNPYLLLVLGLAIGGGLGYVLRTRQLKDEEQKKREKQERALKEAQKKAEQLVSEARSEAMKAQEEVQKEIQKKRQQFQESESRLLKKERSLDEKVEKLDEMKVKLEEKSEKLKEERQKADQLVKARETELQKVASLSTEDAKKMLMTQIEEEFQEELVAHAKQLEQDMEQEVQDKARQVLVDAIQRYASETTVESTTTSVNLPEDGMKGRIIGREGRNINAFETVTGVDVIVDDTPGAVIISAFDPIRRYMAKVTLERLLEDGRVHPARIEETYEKVKAEAAVLIKELGEKAALEAGVAGLSSNVFKILGRLKFRIAYGQNVLKHCIEVSFLAGEMAGMLGANVDVCKKAGLLHDIGKAVDHEVQGKHAFIGRDILKKFDLPESVIHCVEANEGDTEATTLEAKIVQAANLIAVSRPGANKDNLDRLIKRLSEVESLATSFEGVERAVAIQAGKQLRVFVNPEELNDLQSIKLSHSIARKLEKEMSYPGKIKVEVIREKREAAFAE